MTENNLSPGPAPEETSQYPERVAADIQNHCGKIQTKTLPEIMADEIGHYIVCQMLIGTNKIVVFEGVLTQVGTNYFVLFDESTNTLTSCDMYSLKFVTFFAAGMTATPYAEVPQDVQQVENKICRWYDNMAGSNGFRYMPLNDSTIGGSVPRRLREEGNFYQNRI